jgi:hypothetical protein
MFAWVAAEPWMKSTVGFLKATRKKRRSGIAYAKRVLAIAGKGEIEGIDVT